MKALFAHDHVFFKDNRGIYYSKGSLNEKLWTRYLNHFDTLYVAGRVKEIDYVDNKINKSSREKVNFIELPSLSDPILRFKNSNIVNKRLTETIKECDLVIARMPSEIGISAIKIAKLLNKPWMIEVVGCAWDAIWNYGNWKGKIYAPIAFVKNRKYIKQAPYSIYVTKEFLQGRYPTQGKSIACSDVEILDINNDIKLKRIEKIHEDKLEFNIGLIGNISNNIKGIDVALEAMCNILKINSNVKLKILGSGDATPWIKECEKLGIQEKVEFCGTLSNGEAVFKWLDELDLYIQPSYQEGLPRAVIEAMSRACPVVASNVGGILELIDFNYTHNAGDSKILSELIIKVINSKDILEEQAKKNFEKSKEYYRNKLNKRRDEFFKEIINDIKINK